MTFRTGLNVTFRTDLHMTFRKGFIINMTICSWFSVCQPGFQCVNPLILLAINERRHYHMWPSRSKWVPCGQIRPTLLGTQQDLINTRSRRQYNNHPR